MTIETKNLNQAAMLVALGAKVIRLFDTSPRCGFVIEANKWQIFYEKHIGIIPYRYFCRHRTTLKMKAYAHSGRSSVFSGKKDGFIFSDVVKIRPFSSKEIKNLKLYDPVEY